MLSWEYFNVTQLNVSFCLTLEHPLHWWLQAQYFASSNRPLELLQVNCAWFILKRLILRQGKCCKANQLGCGVSTCTN